MRAEQRRKERAKKVVRDIVEIALQGELDDAITMPKQKGKMVEFKMYLFPEEYKKLRKLSMLHGKTMSEIIRNALEDYFNKIEGR
jgi:hypothetical protein